MPASLIGGLGQALSGYPPRQCRCRSRARTSLRTRHQSPSIMGFEDEVEQSLARPCRQGNGRFKRTYELTSSIVPRGTSLHRWVDLRFLVPGTVFLEQARVVGALDGCRCALFCCRSGRGQQQPLCCRGLSRWRCPSGRCCGRGGA
jgi:hypothetical protein